MGQYTESTHVHYMDNREDCCVPSAVRYSPMNEDLLRICVFFPQVLPMRLHMRLTLCTLTWFRSTSAAML